MTLLALARGVGLRRLRLVLITSLLLIVSSQALLLGQILGSVGWVLTFFVILFSSLALTFLSVADSISSNQVAGVLEFLGARRRTILKATLFAVIGYGLLGALAGTGLGLMMSSMLPVVFRSAGAAGAALMAISAISSSVCGIAIGAGLGVGVSWKRKD